MSCRSAVDIIDNQYLDTQITEGGGYTSANGLSCIISQHDSSARTDAQTEAHHTPTLCLLAAVVALAIFATLCTVRIRRLKATLRQLRPDLDNKTVSADNQDNESYRPYENRSTEYDRIFLSQLDNLISENLCNHDMNVDYLATKMLISRSLLFHRVKRITGKSVVEYINEFRIAKAKELMQDARYNLTEISELVGFSSLRYFSRVFKSVTGESPSVYRQQRPPDRQ